MWQSHSNGLGVFWTRAQKTRYTETNIENVYLDTLIKASPFPILEMMNSASPDAALRWWRLPIEGIGLARMEFIINNVIKIHPMALLHSDRVEEEDERDEIEKLTRGYSDKSVYFVKHLARGIAKIAASQYPDPVIVRLSDFKTNDYADLIGGKHFEPQEENPMLGWRGASRYYDEHYMGAEEPHARHPRYPRRAAATGGEGGRLSREAQSA